MLGKWNFCGRPTSVGQRAARPDRRASSSPCAAAIIPSNGSIKLSCTHLDNDCFGRDLAIRLVFNMMEAIEQRQSRRPPPTQIGQCKASLSKAVGWSRRVEPLLKGIEAVARPVAAAHRGHAILERAPSSAP